MRKSHYMSATVFRAKRQTTLPEDVCEAAGIKIHDQVDWRFEGGEIRGRRSVPERRAKVQRVRPIRYKGLLLFPQGVNVDSLAGAIHEEREERDERLLG